MVKRGLKRSMKKLIRCGTRSSQKKELNDLRKLVEGIQKEGEGKINVDQEVKKSFHEIMEVDKEKEKEAKRENKSERDGNVEERRTEAEESNECGNYGGSRNR